MNIAPTKWNIVPAPHIYFNEAKCTALLTQLRAKHPDYFIDVPSTNDMVVVQRKGKLSAKMYKPGFDKAGKPILSVVAILERLLVAEKL